MLVAENVCPLEHGGGNSVGVGSFEVGLGLGLIWRKRFFDL